MVKASVAALVAAVPATLAFTGFNTGSSNLDGSAKSQANFEAEFNAAKKLAGTNGAFTSSRLYTMIQGGTSNTVISAIPAAINTNTNLLLGLWASGTDNIDNELTALKTAIQQFPALGSHCVGISVGSEDLYRNSPTGIANKAGVGQEPAVLARFINQVKDAVKGTALSGCPVGHVDTWTAYQNATANQAVIDAIDFAGTDGYPYFQTQSGDNAIARGPELFFDSVNVVKNAVGSKPVWVTETGWPWQGPTVGSAVASKENAKTYWDNVYCKLQQQGTNTFWYTLVDANSADAATFGVLGSDLNAQPVYDLSCSNTTTSSSSSAVSSATGAASSVKSGVSSALSTGAPAYGSGSGASSIATQAAASATGAPAMPGGAEYTNIATSAGASSAQATGAASSAAPYTGTASGVYGGSNSTGSTGSSSSSGSGSSSGSSSSGSSSGASSGSSSSGSSTGSGSGSATTPGASASTPSTYHGAASAVTVKGSIFGLVAAAAAVLFL